MGIKCPKCNTENPSDSKYCKECSAQLPSSEEIPFSHTKTLQIPTKELPRGTTFAGRYQVIEEIGRGGMGVVYKAEDTRLKRTVALKFLPAELTSNVEAKERFVREAQAAAALDHPNICTVHEIDEAEEKTFISMAYIEGQSLKERIEKGPLEIDEALNITVQVADGLEEAHKKGVVHRDIKSANIMVTGKGQAKIMDFGLAKVAGGSLVTKEGTTMGTLAYMSPEQTRGEKTDNRTDIWSLGVVLYEMLSGQLPFKGEHEASVLYSIVNEEAKALKNITSIPEELEQVVGKALSKNPDERYQKVGELLEDLRAVTMGLEPVMAKARPRKVKLAQIKRNFLYAGIAVLVVVVFVFGFYLFTMRGRPIDSIAVLPFENVNADPDTEYLSDGITETLINKLSKLPNFKRVINRNSVFTYKGQKVDPGQVGRELDVKAVLITRMVRSGDMISISPALVNTSDNSQIWGEKYTREFKDVFALEEEIAMAITQALQLKLTDEAKQQLTKRDTENLEAYDLYLLGRKHLRKRSPNGLKRAIEYFQQAIEQDSSYAEALAGLADAYGLLPNYGGAQPKEVYPKAKAAVEKALELDSTCVEAHTVLGRLKYAFEWDWIGSEKHLKRAIELNPNYAEAHFRYGLLLTKVGRAEEALDSVMRGQALDPLWAAATFTVGQVFWYLRKTERAIEEFRRAIELDSTYAIAHLNLGFVYYQASRFEEARSEWESLVGVPGFGPGWERIIENIPDDRAKALEAFDEWVQITRLPSGWYIFAGLYSLLGEKDSALEWLEKAYEERQLMLNRIGISPYFDPLRSEPRFQELLKKVGLE